MGRQNACGYFQWYDPPVSDHMKRAFSRFINKAREAENERDKAINERDKAKATTNLLIMVVVILSLLVLICIFSNKFYDNSK